jgi:pimeloyl-ACP methyl ester carboxylesterase
MKIWMLAFGVLLAVGTVEADWKGWAIQKRHDASLAKAEGTIEGTFDQRIDPTNATDTRTFKQRYFLNSTYAAGADSPVLYYICGEGTCSADDLRGATLAYGKKYKAHLVALEHRYYGRSQPFAELTAENLVHLTTANALADLASFQRHAITALALSGKWFTIGGSYAGSLSAYYRLKYPELTQGSLASSPPVMAKAEFEEYDQTVSNVVGAACGAKMREVVGKVESALGDPAELTRLKMLFDSEKIRNPIDFLYVLADMAAFAVQYGRSKAFCDALTTGSDPVAAYARAGLATLSAFGLTPYQISFESALSVDPEDYFGFFGMRQWLWQSCTEYGYWQVAHRDPAVSVRSKLINLAYHDQVCERIFGLRQSVDTSGINRGLYEKLLDPSVTRVIYTNGSTDPWKTLSITSENGNDVNPNTPSVMIAGGSHCSDLGSIQASGAIREAQDFFATRLEGWLR